jgi:hypothetical protein
MNFEMIYSRELPATLYVASSVSVRVGVQLFAIEMVPRPRRSSSQDPARLRGRPFFKTERHLPFLKKLVGFCSLRPATDRLWPVFRGQSICAHRSHSYLVIDFKEPPVLFRAHALLVACAT